MIANVFLWLIVFATIALVRSGVGVLGYDNDFAQWVFIAGLLWHSINDRKI